MWSMYSYKYDMLYTSLWSSLAGDNHKVALPCINNGGVVFSPSTVLFVCDMFQVFSNMLKLGQGYAGDSNSWKSSIYWESEICTMRQQKAEQRQSKQTKRWSSVLADVKTSSNTGSRQKSVLRIRIRIDLHWFGSPGFGSVWRMRIRIRLQEQGNWQKNYK